MKNKLIKSNPLLTTAVSTIQKYKIEEPVLLDLSSLPLQLTYDYLLICTCRTEVQMRGLLNRLQKNIKQKHLDVYSMEYSTGVKWGILDCSELVIHIFEKNARKFYALERLWADAEFIELSPETERAEIPTDTEDDEYL